MTAAPAGQQAGGVPLLDDWDDAPLATATARPLPPVTVLLGPARRRQHHRGAAAAHDPAAGRVTVHPTPATSSPSALACDLLAEEYISGTAPAWQAVTACTASGRASCEASPR